MRDQMRAARRVKFLELTSQRDNLIAEKHAGSSRVFSEYFPTDVLGERDTTLLPRYRLEHQVRVRLLMSSASQPCGAYD